MTGWLDKLPPALRHFLFAAAAVLATFGVQYVSDHYTEWSLPEVVAGAIGALLPIAVAAVTSWTQQYGRGAVSDTGTTGSNGTQDG